MKRVKTVDDRRPQRLAAAAKPPLQRQVFLSHTGQDDTAKHFTASVLKPALELAGLHVVIDYETLKPGDDWAQKLVDAAANSAVFVAVLSSSYTHRFWCMLELDLALNAHRLQHQEAQPRCDKHCGGPRIIPVFLDDHNSIVHPQPATIQQHWEAVNAAKCLKEKWAEQCDLGAFLDPKSWQANVAKMLDVQNVRLTSFTGKDQLQQLAREVVQAAVQQLPPLVEEGSVVVGLEERVTELVVQLSCGRLGVWLHGTGGLGKTTLGKALHNRLLSTGLFQCSAVVEVQHDDGNDTTKLAGHLRGALTKLTGKEPAARSAAELSSEMKVVVATRRVLYMLDNVWTPEQLQHLLPTKWGEGSLVIITSRATTTNSPALRMVERQLLVQAVEVLDCASATELFRLSAGLPEGPPAALGELEEQLVKRCAGLPLALTVVGGSLYGIDDVSDWEAALAAFKQGVSTTDTANELRGVLEHSLKGMDSEAVSMFLDVATVLRGWSKDCALTVWEGWHGPGARGWLRDLQRRSLLEVNGRGQLGAHDVVVVLGRRMVLNSSSPHYGSRLWVEEGRVVGVPKEAAHNCKVLVAELDDRMPWGPLPSFGFSPRQPDLYPAAAEMDWSEARVLLLRRAQVPALAPTVLWVEVDDWRQLAGGSQLGPSRLSCAQLRSLQVANSMSLQAFPECLWSLTNLQHLRLNNFNEVVGGAENLAGLSALRTLEINSSSSWEFKPPGGTPQSLQLPSSLRSLCLEGCDFCTALPVTLGRLTLLTNLSMSCCPLAVLPDELGNMAALRSLVFTRCSVLTSLPETLGRLSQLTRLDLSYCYRLGALPLSLGQLTGLEDLNLGSCWNLGELPPTVGGLTRLRQLNFCSCNGLTALPETLGHLTMLERLFLPACTRLVALPVSFGQLASLKWLDLRHCSQLACMPAELGGLTSLTHLNLSECDQIVLLPQSLCQLTLLCDLWLNGCSQLSALPDKLGSLAFLTRLELNNCRRLGALPASIGQLTSLNKLQVGCRQLVELPAELGRLPLLTDLSLSGCERLASLPHSLGRLVSLRRLVMSHCVQLAALPDSLGQVTTLAMLNCTECTQLVSLPEALGLLTLLTSLHLEGCSQLAVLPESLGRLASLRWLDLKGCSQLVALPDSVGQLASLKLLRMRRCSRLAALPESIGALAALQQLHLSGCSSLAQLPESMGQLASLQRLHLSGCTRLVALPVSLGQLTSLEYLTAKGCDQLPGQLQRLPAELLQRPASCRWGRLMACPGDDDESDCDYRAIIELVWEPDIAETAGGVS